LKGARTALTITASTPNDGAFNWKIPSTLATGTNYKIRITSTTKGTVKDSSDKNFKITKAVANTIKITKPNGGESYTTGKVVRFVGVRVRARSR
jgi:hypothetical protein